MSSWHVSYAKIGSGQIGYGSMEVTVPDGIFPRKGLTHKELEGARKEVLTHPDHQKGVSVVILAFSRMEDEP